MNINFPYVSSPGSLAKLIAQLRKKFPDEVGAESLKSWGIAPRNESYFINTLVFLGIIDEAGKTAKEIRDLFVQDDLAFKKGFEFLVRKAYKKAFDLFGEEAWDKTPNDLISFFRSDGASELIGQLRSKTFKSLSGLAGHGDILMPKETKKPSATKAKEPYKARVSKRKTKGPLAGDTSATDILPDNDLQPLALTVRIEVNLPANADQATYDSIFKSIRENLINGRKS
jgi:hypothetical protein